MGSTVNDTNRADGRSLLMRSTLTFSPTCRYTSTRLDIAASRTCGTQNTQSTSKHNYRFDHSTIPLSISNWNSLIFNESLWRNKIAICKNADS